jgi:murein DD-endopeptidase MepM/ murein hydrolase activator NlpD
MKLLRASLATLAAFGAGAASATPAAAEVRPICFPVEGGTSGATWTDSFGDPRGTGRTHEGQDLMSVGAKKMRNLLSAVDGTVREIVFDNANGNRLVIQDAEGWFYVYIHVNNDTPGTDDGNAARDQVFAAGLAVGQRVTRCQPVAFMGDSGNAEGANPHLHFEIRQPSTNSNSWAWSSATPINPHESLQASVGAAPAPSGSGGGGGTATAAPRGRWAPFNSVSELVSRQYQDFYGRAPDSGGATYWANRLNGGVDTPTSFIGRLLTAPEFEARVAPVARLYWAYFDRIPDTDGLLHWIGETADHGATLDTVSQAFAGSEEFRSTYGSLSDPEFVQLVYRNVLDRAPDADGQSYWNNRLASGGSTRGQVMTGFSESPEYRGALASKVRVVLAYVAMLERSPDQGGLDHWAALGVNGLVQGVYSSDEYRARVTAFRASTN